MRVRELSVTYRPHPSGAIADARSLLTSRNAVAILQPMLEHQAQEVFVILLLNMKYKLIAAHEISRGGLNETTVDPRVIFRAALLVNSPALILSHNHPSGDPAPSEEDLTTTRRIVAGGEILGIDVVDHLIIGDRCYCSLKDTGRM